MIKSFNQVKNLLPLAFVFAGSSALAAPFLIIDSGTDFKHPDLINHALLNPKEIDGDGMDNDNNGYIDDVHGWNFAENNNQVIDYKYLGKFSPDVKKFFEIQLKVLNGTASAEDKKWIEEKRKDQNFIKELMTYGNFVHGTHVAGIASKSAQEAKLMAAKIIPTEIKMPGGGMYFYVQSLFQFDLNPLNFLDDLKMQFILSALAGKQSESLTAVGKYAANLHMQVANCSFGTSMTQAKMVVGMIGKMILQRDLTNEEVEKYASYFIEQVIEKGASFVTSSSQTLFVMAAGNDGTDNDKMPVFPANLKYDNTITVAATREYDRLASFSNFGATKVEIAAPGVGIVSAVPGGETLALSGTSQAAPFVANLAGRVLDANPKLTLPEVKKLLMQTVDKKSFLEGKVASAGIANPDRALRAATLSKQFALDEAISRSRTEIADLKPEGADGMDWEPTSSDSNSTTDDGMPIPLPGLFPIL